MLVSPKEYMMLETIAYGAAQGIGMTLGVYLWRSAKRRKAQQANAASPPR